MKTTTPQPTAAQQAWMQLGYGMFIHFGPNTFSGVAWGDGSFPADGFNPTQLNCDQWAEVAGEAGMKYAVLTTKHHDGFCLWPSAHTEYSVKNSPQRVDVVGAYVEAFRKAGIQPGFYYSLWDGNSAHYDNDELYAQYMRDQMTELLSNYGPIVQMWFDGGWDKEFPTRDWAYEPGPDDDPAVIGGSRWQWRELYEHIHRLQPDCLVFNNSSSHRPGHVRYHPLDGRTSEHFDFIYQSQVCHPVLDTVWENAAGEKVFLPLEYCTSLNPDWFWIAGKYLLHPSVETICGWHRTARQSGANLLLNIGPDNKGLVPEYHRQYLKEAARELF
jgi:alpha-L-fucosidase